MKSSLKRHFIDNSTIYMILVFGLLLRLCYIWEYSQLPDWTQLTVDNNFHHHWALSIVDGNILGDTTYFRAPLYVFYLAGIYKLFGVSLWAVRLFSILPGLLSIYITFITGREIYNKKTGLVAGLIHACFPIIYYFESELLLDSFFMLLLQIGIYFFIKWWKNDIVKYIFLSGLSIGLASITRPTALVVALFLMCIIIIIKRSKQQSILLFVIGMTICIAPVFVRNIVVADDPVLIASQGGINLYVGNNDAADGLSAVLPEPLGYNWHIKQISYVAEQATNKQLLPSEVSSYWTTKAIDWIVENPQQFISLYCKKIYYNISNREISNNRYLTQFFHSVNLLRYNFISFGILFSLAFASIVLTKRNNKQALFLIGLIVLYILVTSIFFFSSRFRLPILPYYIILSANTLVMLLALCKQNIKQLVLPLSVILVLGVITFYPIVPISVGSASHLYTSKGIYYASINDQVKALAYFQKANELEIDYPENNLNIGATYLKLGEIDSALYYVNREKNLHPLQSKGFTNSASIYYTLEKYDSAFMQIKSSIAIEPYKITTNQLYARILFQLNYTFLDIQSEINKIRKRTDDNIYILNDLASLIYNDTTITNSLAISILKDAIVSNPPAIEIDDNSFKHYSPNRLDEWNKQRAISYYHLGYIYGISGNYSDAILHSKLAIQIDSSLVDAYVNLISGYFSENQIIEGQRVLKIGLEKFPNYQNLLQIQKLIAQ